MEFRPSAQFTQFRHTPSDLPAAICRTVEGPGIQIAPSERGVDMGIGSYLLPSSKLT